MKVHRIKDLGWKSVNRKTGTKSSSAQVRHVRKTSTRSVKSERINRANPELYDLFKLFSDDVEERPPCWFKGCERILADCDAELREAIAAGGCSNCKKSAIKRKHIARVRKILEGAT